MKKFSELKVDVKLDTYVGEKIKIEKILNNEITIHKFKIEPSTKFDGNCLVLQIEYKGEKRVVFTSAVMLMAQCKAADKKDFPFKATIQKIDDRLQFT